MSIGHLILLVRRAGAASFGELSRARYDDASPKRAGRREAVLAEIMSSRDSWEQRHFSFRNASFRIEDEPASYQAKKFVVSGTPYDAP